MYGTINDEVITALVNCAQVYMKKRRLSSIILLDVITLGFYELYWLAKTRNEMASKLRLNVPSALWLILAKTVQIGCILFTIYAVLFAIPANSKRIDNLIRPSPQCFIAYTESRDAARAGKPSTLSQHCRQQMDNYYFQSDSTVQLLLVVASLYVLSATLMWLLLKRWFVPYAEAIAKATQQRINSTQAMLLLTAAPSPLGMIFIQRTFNQS